MLLHCLRLILLLSFFAALALPSYAARGPYTLRISCGARDNVHSPPTNTLWDKDFAYTGGVPMNATRPSFITPPLSTLRYFPLSEGPENCYIIKRVPTGHYSVRVFFGLVDDPNFDSEPLFDVSVEGTLIDSLSTGWSTQDNEQVFAEALVFVSDRTASICFHSTGHGDPAVLSIEILQVHDKAYYVAPQFGSGLILKTVKRFSCGAGKPRFDEDYEGNKWGGDRFWNSLKTFSPGFDKAISTETAISKVSLAPNFYPQGLYQSALLSTVPQPDLTYMMDVEPNNNYSIWLHFAEIDPSVTSAGERVFDILINGVIVFKAVDIIGMTGGPNTALVLNTTVAVNGRILALSLHPRSGSFAIINGIEVFQIIEAEAQTLPAEVSALQGLKSALQLPHRFGWNGDPCVPQQHPWTGVNCHFDSAQGKWFIDGIGLDNQGLRGFLPVGISQLGHLQSLNLSGNNIHGAIPSSIGAVSGLEILDLSFNYFNGSIPESLGQLNSLKILNLNGNKLSGRVPVAVAGMLLHRARFNFTDNAGLCGIPGLQTCGPHISTGAKVGIAVGSCVGVVFLVVLSICWWKRRQNILRTQRIIAAREAPYAKARTQFSRDIQMTAHNARMASENGPSLLS